jgi:hypothetical protein
MRRSPSRDVRFSVPHQAACLSLADRRPKRVPTQLALSCARPIPATVACRPPCGMDGESMGQDWRGGISICRAREERGNVGLFHGKGWGIANCIGWLISNRNPSSARSLPSGTTRPGGAPSPSEGEEGGGAARACSTILSVESSDPHPPPPETGGGVVWWMVHDGGLNAVSPFSSTGRRVVHAYPASAG